MLLTASLAPLGLATALFAAQEAVAVPAQSTQQAPFVLVLEGLTAANQATLQAELTKVNTVAKVAVDAASGKVSLYTAEGAQLDTDAAKAAAVKAGLKVAKVDLPAWASETVWTVTAKGGS